MKTPDGKDMNVLSKTPEEIKKGLEVCIGKCVGDKPHCPYHTCGDGCMDSMNRDALALIQQLEDDINRIKQTTIYYSSSEGAENLEHRIKFFDKSHMLNYVENGVFLTDKSFNDASGEVKRFYEKYYSPEPPKEE